MSTGLERLWHRLQLVIGRGRIAVVDDEKSAQVLQVKLGADETKDGIPRIAEYGFVSNPPIGSDAVVLFLAGERTNAVVVGTNNQTVRMTGLATGEVAIHDDKGRFVLLGAAGIHVQGKDDPVVVETTGDVTATAGGNITLTAAVKIKLAAPTVEIDATDVNINANTNLTGAVTNDGHDIGFAHEHVAGTYKVGSSAVTGVSGGVTP